MSGVVCRSARYCLHICSVLSTDFLDVVCRPARFCLQMCSVMYAGLFSIFCRSSQRCLKMYLVFSANLLGFVCRLARFCLQTCSVLSAILHKCETGSFMFSSRPGPLAVKPCLVLTVHFDCSSSEITSLCTFLFNHSLCLYVISFFLLLHFKTTLFTAWRIGCPV